MQAKDVKFKGLPNSFSLPDIFKEEDDQLPFSSSNNRFKNTKLIIQEKDSENNLKLEKDPSLRRSSISADSMVIINRAESERTLKSPIATPENDDDRDGFCEFDNISLTSLSTMEILKTDQEEETKLLKKVKHPNLKQMDVIRERADSICQKSII